MFKVLRNLRKSTLSVIAIVLLLCVQAWADLTLPDYTSKIVNIGIQQGGIENAVPEVIRKSQMDTLLLFTEEDETILAEYKLLTKSDLEEKEYEKYKIIQDKKFLSEEDKNGIHVLGDDAVVGKDPVEYMNLKDSVIDFELTANRGDLLSILGMAYELVAIYDKKVHRKLMLEACKALNSDLEQINKLYDIILKEIAGRSTKKIYKENYIKNQNATETW